MIEFANRALPLRCVEENTMPTRSREEVLAYAEGVYKLMRARKHLENRGAERACIQLLESVIKKTEQEFFKPTISALPIGAPGVDFRKRPKRTASTRLRAEQ
jgi:hypothetical protein